MPQNLSRRAGVIKRLRYLWTWELFDSLFIPAMVFLVARMVHQPVGPFALYGMALVAWLLWQGSAYWWLKLRAVKAGTPIPPAALRWFARFKGINWGLIALLPLVLAAEIAAGTLAFDFNLVAGIALYGLAVLEQINYYHYQLMYDSMADLRYLARHKRLKVSSLRRTLEGMG